MGAVVVDQENRVVSVGYNGFARGVYDSPDRYSDREVKLRMVVHAEMNAIIFAQRDLSGCTLYTTPFMPCARCAAMVIQAGIKRSVAPVVPAPLLARWGDDLRLALQMFSEAEVSLTTYED